MRRIAAFAAIPLALATVALFAAACSSSGDKCDECVDIVSGVPWTPPESHVYELKKDNSAQGMTTLSVKQDGQNFVLTTDSEGTNGTSDVSAVTADATTLKPVSATRTITDKDTRTLLEVTYEDVAKDQCDSGRVARIKQSTFKPPEESTPDSSRSNPLCVPDHAYDNDESLFIWRTIKFATDAQPITYWTITAGRRDKHLVTLTVQQQEQITVPAGTFDAWKVEIASERSRQNAWFATTPDHRLLQYVNNQGQTFQLQGEGG
jgi:hypothetical protein